MMCPTANVKIRIDEHELVVRGYTKSTVSIGIDNAGGGGRWTGRRREAEISLPDNSNV